MVRCVDCWTVGGGRGERRRSWSRDGRGGDLRKKTEFKRIMCLFTWFLPSIFWWIFLFGFDRSATISIGWWTTLTTTISTWGFYSTTTSTTRWTTATTIVPWTWWTTWITRNQKQIVLNEKQAKDALTCLNMMNTMKNVNDDDY